MAFIPFDSTVRVAFRNTSAGHNLVTTAWFRNLSEWGLTEVEELADDLDLWWASQVVAQLCETVTYQETTVYDMRSADSFLVVNDDNTGEIGASAPPAASLASAMTVTFGTARRGRSYRGRAYMSGWSEANVNNTQFEASAVSGMDAAWQTLPGVVTPLGWTQVVASREQNGVPLLAGVTTPVTSYRANATIYSQRNRTR